MICAWSLAMLRADAAYSLSDMLIIVTQCNVACNLTCDIPTMDQRGRPLQQQHDGRDQRYALKIITNTLCTHADSRMNRCESNGGPTWSRGLPCQNPTTLLAQ